MIRERALARFARLREQASLGADGPLPAGWCVSTIARIERNAPELLDDIAVIQRGLAGAFLYPAPSLHVSLVGCTQREDVPPDPARARAIALAVQAAVTGPAVPVEIGCLNRIGEQLFLEVLTDSPRWAQLRDAVADAAEAIGEAPLRYADLEPMHLNIARGAVPADLSVALSRPATLSVIEVVVTDFVVSPESLRIVDLMRI